MANPKVTWSVKGDMITVINEKPDTTRDAAYTFMKDCGLDPTEDAVGQLTEAFLPCLRIMCQRGYDPQGRTWRQAGRLGALADMRKKFFRLWERAWIRGGTHDDSAYDLINYTGFYLRIQGRWGEWGEPGRPEDPEKLEDEKGEPW